MDICRNFLYQLDMACSIVESAEYEYNMCECVLIETGEYNLKNIRSIQEGFAETVKNFFNSVPNIINGLMQKFEDLFNMRYIKDKEYIETYKQHMDQPIKYTDKISVYPYNVELIMGNSIPSLNYESIKDSLDDLYAAQKKIFPNFAGSSAEDFVENIKKKFRGEPSTEEKPTIDSSSFKLDQACKYIENYVETKKKLTSDKKQLLSTVNAFKNITEAKKNEQKVEAQNNSYYSDVYGKVVFLEEEDNTQNNSQETNQEKPADNKDQSDNKSEKDKAVGDILKKATTAVKDGTKEFSETFKRTKNGINVVSKFFAAKMTIANECYKSYMEIIRSHVESYDENAKSKKGKTDKSETNNNDNESLTPEETKEVENISKEVIKSDGTAKDMDDAGKANLFNRISNAVHKKAAGNKIYNAIVSKMKKK